MRRDATAQGWILLSIDITSSFHRMAFDCDTPTDGVSITHFNSDVNTPIWAYHRIVIFGIAVKSNSSAAQISNANVANERMLKHDVLKYGVARIL